MAGTGILLGGLASLLVIGALSGLLYRLRPEDPLTFAMAGLGLAVITVVACVAPALRAARVEPLTALRAE